MLMAELEKADVLEALGERDKRMVSDPRLIKRDATSPARAVGLAADGERTRRSSKKSPSEIFIRAIKTRKMSTAQVRPTPGQPETPARRTRHLARAIGGVAPAASQPPRCHGVHATRRVCAA